MKKLFIITILLLLSFYLFSNRFWNNDKNYKQIITVESIISYSPSVVNYRYTDDNSKGYYFSDCAQWSHLFNIYPVFQTGTILNYRWTWGLKTFVFSNLYRICGFNFDVYNLSFQISFMDIGFSWFKYEWNKKITGRNNQLCLLFSPITTGISYRMNITKYADIQINIGYSLQMIKYNKIVFPNSNVDASMFLEHVFNSGLGFKFYTKNFKE